MYSVYVNVKIFVIILINMIVIIEIKLNWDNCLVCVNVFKNIFLFKNLFKNGILVIDRVVIVMIRFILGNSWCILFKICIFFEFVLWSKIFIFMKSVYLKMVWFIRWNSVLNNINI